MYQNSNNKCPLVEVMVPGLFATTPYRLGIDKILDRLGITSISVIRE